MPSLRLFQAITDLKSMIIRCSKILLAWVVLFTCVVVIILTGERTSFAQVKRIIPAPAARPTEAEKPKSKESEEPKKPARPPVEYSDKKDKEGKPLPKGALARLGSTHFHAPAQITAMAYISDQNKIAVLCSNDQTLRLCDLKTGTFEDVVELSEPASHNIQARRVSMLQYAAKYKLAIIVTDKSIAAYHLGNKKLLWRNELVTNRASSNYLQFQISQDNEYIACGNSLSEIKFYKVADGKDAGTWQTNGLQAMAGSFTPDGKSFGLTTRSSDVKYWSLTEKKVLEDSSIKLTGNYIYSTNYSPNGKYLAYIGNTKFVIYDVEKKTEEKEVPPISPGMRWFAFSPDSLHLIYLDNQAQLRTWDLETKKDVKFASTEGQTMAFIAYGLNYPVFGEKNQLYYAMGPTLRGLDYITGEPIHDNEASHAMHIGNSKISPNGRWIATVSYDSTIIWDREGNHIYTDRQTNANMYGLLPPLAWTPDGKYLIHPRDQSTLEFLDVEKLTAKKIPANKAFKNGAVARELKYGPGPLYNIFISSDGKQLLGTGIYQTTVISRWNLEDKETLTPTSLPASQNLNSNQVDVSDDFRWIVMNSVANAYDQPSGGRNAVQVLDLNTNATIQRFDRETSTPRLMNVVCMQFSGYDRLLTETRTTNIVIWDILSGKMALDIGRDGPSGNISVSEISPDGRWLTWIESDFGVRFYDVLNAKVVGRFMNNRTTAHSIEMHVNGDNPFVLTGGADTTALVWDVSQFMKDAIQQSKNDQPLDKLWTDLMSEDTLTTQRALWKLIERGDESIEMFQKNVEPSKENSELPSIVKSLIAKMDSPSFSDREEATRRARELGEIAEPLFSDALKETSSAEVRSRIRAIVADWKQRIETLTPKQQRNVRTVLIAEKIGTPSARAFLKSLTAGDPHAKLTREATRTLERLEKQ